MKALVFSLAMASLVPLSVQATEYKVDPGHTNVGFTSTHMMISKVKGRFDKVEGSFQFDEKSMKLENVNVTIKADSINTNQADRDKHLRSPEFFDVTKYPDITFKGNKVSYDKDKKPEKIEGDLTIHGVTKKVTLEIDYNGSTTDPWGNQVVAFELEGKVNRKDFGLNWNKSMDKGGVVLGDEIKIEIDGEAKSAAAAPAKK